MPMTIVNDIDISEKELDDDDINGVYVLGRNKREDEIRQSIELVEHNGYDDMEMPKNLK